MKKLSFYFGIFFVVITLLLFGGCSESSPQLPYKGLYIRNDARHFFGGIPEIVIDNNDDLDFIFDHINKFKNKETEDVLINSNFGLIEVRVVDSINKSYYLLYIAMTEFYGDVVVYKWSKYYYNTLKNSDHCLS